MIRLSKSPNKLYSNLSPDAKKRNNMNLNIPKIGKNLPNFLKKKASPKISKLLPNKDIKELKVLSNKN